MDRALEDLATTAQACAEKVITPTHSMDFDMVQSAHMLHRVRNNRAYAQNLYAALCNNRFQFQDPWLILQDKTWCCSWRTAAGIVADMCGQGHYLDWYCSGMTIWKEEDGHRPDPIEQEYVPEGMITEEIAQDLACIGWIMINQAN